jgi:hypothetical protein
MTRQDLVRSEFGDSVDHFRQAAIHAAGGVGATVGPMSARARDMSGRAWDMSGRAREMSGRAREMSVHAKDLSGSARAQMNSARQLVGPAAGRLSRSATTRAASRWNSSWNSTIATFAPLADAAREGAAKAIAIEAKNAKARDSKKTRTMNQTTDNHSTRNVVAIIACGAAMGAAGALVARRRNRAKWAEYEPSSLESDASSLLDPNATATTSVSGGNPIKKASDMTKSAVGTVRSKIQDVKSSRQGSLDEGSKSEMGSNSSDLTDETRTAMKQASEKANEGASHFSGNAESKLSSSSDAEDMMRSRNGRK